MLLYFFFQICQIMGLTGIDLFSPSDVVERRDTRRVCMCIRSLSIKARSKNLDVSKEKENLYHHEMFTYLYSHFLSYPQVRSNL